MECFVVLFLCLVVVVVTIKSDEVYWEDICKLLKLMGKEVLIDSKMKETFKKCDLYLLIIIEIMMVYLI